MPTVETLARELRLFRKETEDQLRIQKEQIAALEARLAEPTAAETRTAPKK